MHELEESNPPIGMTEPFPVVFDSVTRRDIMGNRKHTWQGVVAMSLAGMLTLAGCSSANTSKTASSSGDGGKIVYAITADPVQWVPWTATSEQSLKVLSQLYTPLLSSDEKGSTVAGLADLPEISDDGLTYTFKLKSGVKFSDGSELDSEDVKYTFDTIKNPDSGASSATYLKNVESVEATDPQTVTIKLKQPDASFPAGLTSTTTSIVPKDATVDSLQDKPDGTGPFKFVKHTANQNIELTRNDDYFEGKPGFKDLEFRVIPDEQSIVSSLKTGSVDLAIFSNPVTAKSAASNNVTTETAESLTYHVLQLRADSKVLSNVNSRLAIQCAISRKDVIDSAALGAGSVTGPITSPDYKSDTSDQPCAEQDLDKAKEYLKKAGTPDGFDLNMITSQGLYSSAVDEAQNVQAQLKKVGINVKIETLDSNAYVKRWLAGDFDSAIAANGGSSDPNTMYSRYFTSTGTYNKVAGYRSDTLDKLFADGIATVDTSKRKEIYKQISENLTDNAAWIWLYTPQNFIVLNKKIQNFVVQVDASTSDLWKATVA